MPHKHWGISNQQQLYVFVEKPVQANNTEKSSKSLHYLPFVKDRDDWLIPYTNGK